MTWENPAAIDGALLEAVVVRTLAYAATGGSEGIVDKGDLKVTADALETEFINVGTGGGLVLNRSNNGGGQSYAAFNRGSDRVAVPDTAGASRTDLVVLKINDPEFTGQVPADPDNYPYAETVVITGVPAGTERASALNLGYPAVELARITRPATSTTVSSGQITDLRKLALPRFKEYRNHYPVGSNPNMLNVVAPAWEPFPGSATQSVYIPEWATRATFHGFIEGLDHRTVGRGRIRLTLVATGVGGEATEINEPAPGGAVDRKTYNFGGEIPLPSSVRGTNVNFRLEGQVTAAGDAGFLQVNTLSSVFFSILLEEQPE